VKQLHNDDIKHANSLNFLLQQLVQKTANIYTWI